MRRISNDKKRGRKILSLLCAAAILIGNTPINQTTAFAESAPVETEVTAPAPEEIVPEAEVTAPEAEVTTPEAEETAPEAEVTTPEEEETTPEAEETTPAPEGFEEIPKYDDSLIQTYADTDPFTYEANSTGVTITKYNGTDSVVTIPSTYANKKVTAIGAGAFRNNKTLTKVIIPEGVTTVNGDSWSGGAFESCTYLTSVTLPSTMTTIGRGAFYNCQNLLSISIPDNVTLIDRDAFAECKYLASVKMPSKLTTIGFGAFGGCSSLKSLTIPSTVTSLGNYFISETPITSITLPDNLTTIGGDTFGNANSLTSITLPARLETIYYNSFNGCPALQTLSIASSNLKYATVNGVLYSKDMKILYRYPRGKTAASFTVPSGVETLNQDAFNSNPFLTEVTLPESVATIGESAFNTCTSLISLNVLNENTSFSRWFVFDHIDKLQLTLYGYVGSTTETYCNNNSITFGVVRPQTPAIKVTAGDKQATLSWSSQKGVVKYRAFTYLNGKYTQVGEATGTSMTVKNLQNGTKYGFLVLAYNGSVWSSYTTANVVYGTPAAFGLPAFTVTPGKNQATVKWNAVSGAKKYRIFTYLNGKYTSVGETTLTSYVVSGLSGGTKYGFLVLAYNGSAWSPYNTALDVVYATPTGIAKPAFTVTPGKNQATVKWSKVNGAKKYRVFTYLNGKYTSVGETTSTSYVVSGLSGGTKYGFLVLAYDGSSWSPYNTALDVVYATPTGLTKPVFTVTPGKNQATVKWNAVSGAKKYRLFTYLNGKYTQAGETTSTSYVISGLSGGTKYGFLVIAYDGSAWSPYNTALDVVYATPSGLAKPVFTVTPGKNQATVKWNAVSGAKKYRIFTYLNGKYTSVGETTSTSRVITGLSGGTRYGFLVLAYDGSSWSPYNTALDVVYATPTK